MSMKTAREILEEEKASEELIARGWSKLTCCTCKGTGQIRLDQGSCVDTNRAAAEDYEYLYICHQCDGIGWFWKRPDLK